MVFGRGNFFDPNDSSLLGVPQKKQQELEERKGL